MRKLACIVVILLMAVACKTRTAEPGYIVQVSLGGWNNPLYTADQIIGRLDTVSSRINVEKVIIGWSLDKDIYKQVGAFLHSKNIKMLLWFPVFAETEEVCTNVPAVDLWGLSRPRRPQDEISLLPSLNFNLGLTVGVGLADGSHA